MHCCLLSLKRPGHASTDLADLPRPAPAPWSSGRSPQEPSCWRSPRLEHRRHVRHLLLDVLVLGSDRAVGWPDQRTVRQVSSFCNARTRLTPPQLQNATE